MPYPQLAGIPGPSRRSSGVGAAIIVLLALAVLLGVIAWRAATPRTLKTSSEDVSSAAVSVQQAPTSSGLELSQDQLVHLSQAEHQLTGAAEQLAATRRILAAVAPSLDRNYLEVERRRVDAAITTAQAAQRAIEQARANIDAVSKGKE